MIHRRKLIPFLCLLLALFVSSVQPQIISGHADYDHAEPAADAVVATAPTQVRIWFTQELFRRQGMNSIEVYAADGTRQDLGDVAIDDDDRTLMTVSLAPALPDGVYTVRWKSLSAEDGHEGAGEFTFTVGAATFDENTDENTSGAAAQVEPTATPTLQPVVETPTIPPPTATASPPTPTASLPCLGGAAPLVFSLGALWVGHRRRSLASIVG